MATDGFSAGAERDLQRPMLFSAVPVELPDHPRGRPSSKRASGGPARIILGFVLLWLYLRGVPGALNAEGALWVAIFAGFFAAVQGVARWTGLRGLGDCGYPLRQGAFRAASVGVGVGAGLWLLLALAEFATGALQIAGLRSPGAVAWVLLQAVIVAILGSATNDVWVRGYLLAHLRGRLPAAVAIAVSATLYTIDDFALGGLTLRNAVFSLTIGTALALLAERRGELWQATGLHVGLNLVYWVVNGFGGETADRGGVFRLESGSSPWWLSWLGVVVSVLMLAWVMWTTRGFGCRHTNAGHGSDKPRA